MDDVAIDLHRVILTCGRKTPLLIAPVRSVKLLSPIINQLTGAKMNSPEETQVVVTDIQMPFISMVVFMVKWALAAIPALFILFAIFTGLFLVLGITGTP